MPSVPQHRSSSLEIWGRGEAKSFLLESRAGSIISRWQARARNLACLLKLTQSHSFQKLEMPPTKSAWGSSTSLRIWRQLPSSSDHHPISLSPPIQILSWNIGERKNELQGMLSILREGSRNEWIDFWKSSKGGGVIFNPKIYVTDFGNFKQGFLRMKLIKRRVISGFRVCFFFNNCIDINWY